MRASPSTLVLASVLVVLAGCGSSDDTTTGTTGTGGGAAGSAGAAGAHVTAGAAGAPTVAGSGGSIAGGSAGAPQGGSAGATEGGHQCACAGANVGGSAGSPDVGGAGGSPDIGGAGGTEVGGSAGATTGGSASSLCANPVAIKTTDGQDTGYATCENGSITHLMSASVTPIVPMGDCNLDAGSGGAPSGDDTSNCLADTDCTASPYGHCDLSGGGLLPVQTCSCVYECKTDADCGAGKACVPAGVIPDTNHTVCADVTCTGPADCASGECGLSAFNNGCGLAAGLYCHAPSDMCQSNADCGTNGGSFGNGCAWDTQAAHWDCQMEDCAFLQRGPIRWSPSTCESSTCAAKPTFAARARPSRITAERRCSTFEWARPTSPTTRFSRPPKTSCARSIEPVFRPDRRRRKHTYYFLFSLSETEFMQ